ncbi:Uncharacterized protein DUF323 [Rhodovulum sp. PH10]|uniref:ergothioneine biosynthesis protein EgtB n=1 Tax=Rhodovulum sp. PH10 TaxID=1187851 RepID=UPI00027C2A87|nr:ergothioneine biosynthesis protein EgtB [Rhodovulum sp. PH10]EJW11149.1 Uncharacterized protein DUF323 [Rhodovulum sp. PH10]
MSTSILDRTLDRPTVRPASAPLAPAQDRSPQDLLDAFRTVRAHTEALAAPLSAEDQVVQSMPDASPTKWHRAHTTWFFEEFLLVPHAPNYRRYDDRLAYLYNSYYVQAGPRHARPKRGLITRPDVAEVSAYRAHVDRAVEALLHGAEGSLAEEIASIVTIGLNHEQQHQELILTDILHAFSENPCAPVYDAAWAAPKSMRSGDKVHLPEAIHTIGHTGEGFCYDNEGPAHRELVGPASVDKSLVTNGEWLAFIADGGYQRPTLWLSDGWATVAAEGWQAPGYWQQEADGAWRAMTLGGLREVDPDAPVCHVSYYEADAFARWAGRHLPSEAEWEVAARSGALSDAHGVVWQWTRSAYSPYPGFRPVEGAIGEYNGKFMVNQMVLRGSSLATPAGHARDTYRNFFPPAARWQFTGLRLSDAA